jgi:hypothetical protein
MEIFLMWLQLSVGFYKEDVYVFGCSNWFKSCPSIKYLFTFVRRHLQTC